MHLPERTPNYSAASDELGIGTNSIIGGDGCSSVTTPRQRHRLGINGLRGLLLLVLSIVLASYLTAGQALAYDQQFYSGNDILFYDPNACSSGSNGNSGSPALVSGDNVKQAFFYFTDRGLTAAQSAGIVGNLIQESSVNPKSVQAGGPGRGIAQWSAGGRWDSGSNSLKSWAGTKDIYLLITQLDFMWYEMNSVSPWKLSLKGSTDSQYPSLQDIKGDTQAAAIQAGHSFGYLYERFGIAGARDQYAGQVWSKYHSQVVAGGSNSGAGSAGGSCASGASAGSGTCQGAPSGWVQDVNKVVDIACAEWNKKVKEDAPPNGNCDAAGNITKYAKAIGFGSCGLAWCGMFVGYVYKEAGFPFPASAGVASVASVYSYIQSVGAHKDPSTDPTPGSVVTYGTEHEGIVVGVQGKYVTTIEGNTGPDPDDKVNTTQLEGVHMHHRIHPYPSFPQSGWGDFNVLSKKQAK